MAEPDRGPQENRPSLEELKKQFSFYDVPFSMENLKRYFSIPIKRAEQGNQEIRIGDNLIIIVEESKRFVILTGLHGQDEELPDGQLNFPYPETIGSFMGSIFMACGIDLLNYLKPAKE